MAKLQVAPLADLLISMGVSNMRLSESAHVAFFDNGEYRHVFLPDDFFSSILLFAMDLPLPVVDGLTEDQLFSPCVYYSAKLLANAGKTNCSAPLTQTQKRALIRLALLSVYDLAKPECDTAARLAFECFYKTDFEGAVSRLIFNVEKL